MIVLATAVGTVPYAVILGTAYCAGLTCGRLFAVPFALLAAGAVPVIAFG